VQQVQVNGELSDEVPVESGVPQGSILGPILFDVFIDDLDECAALIDILIKFADDTKGMKEMVTDDDRRKMQETIDKIYTWSQDWGMEFNVGKCKIMHIGRTNPRHEYYMNGIKLTTTEEEKDVGVLIHSSLKPSRQCEKAAMTASGVLGQVTRNFHFRDRHVFVQLYKQYVRPHLEFATPAWSPWLTGDKERLEKVQQKMVRQISGLTGVTYEEKCEELGLETLEERRIRADLVQAFKIIHGLDRVRMELLFDIRENRPGTRQANDHLHIYQERARLDLRKNWFTLRVADLWNKIPIEIKSNSNLQHFKRYLLTQDEGRTG